MIGFQIIFGLEKTGVVNKETYDRLFDFYYALIRSLPPSLFEDVARPFPGIDLGPGFDLPEVSYLQDYLTVIASFFPEVPDPGNSGVYDETTEATVRSVQTLAGLPVTGIVDLNTWDAIASLYNDIRSGSLIRPDQYPGYLIE